MDGKVAWVTGAGSGIGAATAVALGAAGARVLCVDIDEAAAASTAGDIVNAAGEAVGHGADVAAEDAVAAMARAGDARWGRLDVAVNCAGILGNKAPTAECTPDNWSRVIGVNLTGIFLCMREEIPRMGVDAAIVNMSSIIGLGTAPTIPAYAASKYGVIGLTRTAAQEYEGTVRVNAICPGAVATPMQTQWSGQAYGRTPEDIARIALWLCTAAAADITGEALTDERWDQVIERRS